jgi:hypothetical protein
MALAQSPASATGVPPWFSNRRVWSGGDFAEVKAVLAEIKQRVGLVEGP